MDILWNCTLKALVYSDAQLCDVDKFLSTYLKHPMSKPLTGQIRKYDDH